MTQLHALLAVPVTARSRSLTFFWFGLSLSLAAVYGFAGIQQAFSGEYVVQDDARQQVFWMQRFLDPALFPQDWIADYFQTVTPPGTAGVYHFGTWLGIDPWTFNKLLPLALGVLTAGYCFALCLELLPLPSAGFVASVLLSQNLWMQDTLISGTAKAFFHPLLLAFLYYLLRRSLLPCLIALALAGLFYPTTALIAAGLLVLRLWHWGEDRRNESQKDSSQKDIDRRYDSQRVKDKVETSQRSLPPSVLVPWLGKRMKSRLQSWQYFFWRYFWRYFAKQRHPWLFCGTGLGITFLVLLPYVLGNSDFGPTVSAAAARSMPEFGVNGRAQFFAVQGWDFWFNAGRSGIRLTAALIPPLVYAGLLLPLLLHFRARLPLLQQVTSNLVLLPQLVVVSLSGFVIAHLLLFKLHLPSRYTQHTLRIVMVLAATIVLMALLDGLLHWAASSQRRGRGQRQTVALAALFLMAGTLVLYPASLDTFLWTGYSQGDAIALYEFFAHQPKDILVASLAEEANNLPTFSRRSILVGREYAIPYHQGYYDEIRQRARDLIQAQYSPSPEIVEAFIHKYSIDFWLLEQSAFNPGYITSNSWLNQYQPEASEAVDHLEQEKTPAIATQIDRCTVFSSRAFIVLQGQCLIEATE